MLSVELFGQSLALPDFPERRDVKGLGMSDWNGYAVPLATKLNYQNTYYHAEPRLDITSIDQALDSQFDFVISTEVFEHVPQPISRAFGNVYKLLKPGGVLIFTAPYTLTGKTVEHFPEIHDYQVTDEGGQYVLMNTTKAGVTQVFDHLIFHGGPGATLEMRLFSESSLIDEFKQAGFHNLKTWKAPCFEYGIYAPDDWSLPMSVRRPK